MTTASYISIAQLINDLSVIFLRYYCFLTGDAAYDEITMKKYFIKASGDCVISL